MPVSLAVLSQCVDIKETSADAGDCNTCAKCSMNELSRDKTQKGGVLKHS